MPVEHSQGPNEAESQLSLGAEFPARSYADWLVLVEQTLKGQSPSRLVSQTLDGIAIQPIYSKEINGADEAALGVPGSLPWVRGASALGGLRSGWDIRQRLIEPELSELNRGLLNELERGATSIELVWDKAARAGKAPQEAQEGVGVEGAPLYSVADMERALAEVDLRLAPMALDAGASAIAAALLYLASADQRGVPKAELLGELGVDPLGALMAGGALHTQLKAGVEQQARLAKHVVENYPCVKTVAVSSRAYSDAGASQVQELAYALATGVAYLRGLLSEGIPVERALGQLVFELSVGTKQLEDIAKLRAFRRLWARVVEAILERADAPFTPPEMQLGARMAWRTLSQRDPWVNLLRATIAGFSAAVGGASSVTLWPFSAALGAPDEFALRVARNTQLVLLEEAHLSRVLDPAGGSYAIEQLTDELSVSSWQLFQAIEARGGMLDYALSGELAQAIAETRSAQAELLAKRKEPITGVSEFPELNERPVRLHEPDLKAVRDAVLRRAAEPAPTLELSDSVDTWFRAAVEGASLSQLSAALGALGGGSYKLDEAARLSPARLASAFEALRDRSDEYLERSGVRPRVLLACIGPVAEHTARATFAKNFFEVGGVEALSSLSLISSGENSGAPLEQLVFSPEAAASAFREAGAQVAVLCSSDKQYEQHAEAFARSLRAAGAKLVYLAGHPKAQPRDYTQAEAGGQVDAFIYVGADVLQSLTELHSLLGIST